MKKDKSFSLDDTMIIKGVAIIFMIFHHLFRLEEFSMGYDMSFWPLSIERVAQIATFMKICVPIFVFLSGYGLLTSYKKTKQYKEFFAKRYFKLMSTFWFTALVSFVLIQIINGDFINYYFKGNIYFGFTNLLYDFLGINGLVGKTCFSPNWWYIGASFIFIFLLPIFYKLAQKYGWLNVGIGIVIVPRIFNVVTPSTTTALPYIFVFYLGMLFEEKNLFKKIKDININIFIKLFFYLTIIVGLYLIHSYYPRNVFWELHFGLVPLVVISFVYEFLTIIPGIRALLKLLGEHSYIMFLTHGFIIDYFKNFIYSFVHPFLITCVLLLVSFGVSYSINYFMKLCKWKNIVSIIEKKCFID